MTPSYREVVESGRPILTDGATGTRLRLETALALDPILDVAGLALARRGDVLRAVAGEYAAIARELELPIQLDAMSYWASPDHLAAAGRSPELAAANDACVAVLAPLKRFANAYIAGVIGPRADGYRPIDAMSVDEAAAYHAPQAQALAEGGADLLLAATMSAQSEAIGVAQAMAQTSTPYVIATVMTADGCMPDGSSVADLVELIDASVSRAPVHFLINCTHPSTALAGMRALRDAGRDVSNRLIGIKANGSAIDPALLDGVQQVFSDAPLAWIADIATLRSEFGFRVLGGCCGTDSRHILALGLHLTDERKDQ